jgi:hypothetical protein
MTPDEGNSKGSRIAFQDKESEYQGFTVPKAPASGIVIYGAELGHDPMGECFCSL